MTGQPLPGWGPLRSRTVSWYDPAATSNGTAGRTGLAFLQAIVDGQLPGPPIASLFDFRIVSVVEGEIVFACTPGESAYNPIGVVHGGLVCNPARQCRRLRRAVHAAGRRRLHLHRDLRALHAAAARRR